MIGIWKALFRPKDGTRRKVASEVEASRVKVEDAANRFEQTILDLMTTNDSVTGRAKNAKFYPPR